MTEVVLGQE
jgi:SNF2 family DNA or RNA helicase